jgi:hypothetical protein
MLAICGPIVQRRFINQGAQNDIAIFIRRCDRLRAGVVYSKGTGREIKGQHIFPRQGSNAR